MSGFRARQHAQLVASTELRKHSKAPPLPLQSNCIELEQPAPGSSAHEGPCAWWSSAEGRAPDGAQARSCWILAPCTSLSWRPC